MTGDDVVLNVDDREVSRYTKTRILKQAGFIVAEAVNGAEALRMAEELQPPVILLDVRLPDISGIEVCRIVKQKWPGIMVLQTSATFTSGADRTRGLDAGADSYLAQPVEPEELIASIRALLRIRAAEYGLRRLNDNLERRVEERTRDLADANESLRLEIAQREKAEAALVQAQKMEAVGHLTGGIAHDFNNLLTAVVGNLDLIRARATDPRIFRLAENAFKAAERGSKLTAQLLAFSRTQKLATKPTDVNWLVSGMRELLSQSLGPSIEIRIQPDAAAGLAMADANQLELAILNLAINARDAMPSGGAVTISTEEGEIVAGEGSLAAGKYVKISVSDTGSGMSAEVMARAFDPFFTTKPPGKGTGLGLAQVYGIAKQCGGEAHITSKPGAGTTVSIWLQHAVAGMPAATERNEAIAPGHRDGNILLVDDDPDVQALVKELLTDLGYQVRVASHGEGGLGLVGEFDPHLLIVDFAMPGMNGAEMAGVVRRTKPDLPILFLSGYADTSALESAVGNAPLLRKPFRPGELAAAVRDAIDKP
jgi:DNA-binding response OmpR family regulator/two-component sensor histidine kinase